MYQQSKSKDNIIFADSVGHKRKYVNSATLVNFLILIGKSDYALFTHTIMWKAKLDQCLSLQLAGMQQFCMIVGSLAGG